MKFIYFAILVTLALAVNSFGQQPTPSPTPDTSICISQAAANACRDNARLVPALEEKIRVLEAALLEKDKNTAIIRAAAEKNVADLTAALHRTEVDSATKTGQLVSCEAQNLRNITIIDLLLKHVKPKKIGLINF